MKTSVIIPAYDEEKTIVACITDAKQHADEVIVVVAKKSKDATFLLASKIADKCILDDGGGKGSALKIGVEQAQGEIIVFMDSDGSHDVADISRIIAPIVMGNYDLVVGSRALGGSDELHGTLSEFVRNTGGALVMLCINYCFNVRFTDCENGFRAVKTQVFKSLDLKANGFDIEQEMFIKSIKNGFKVTEVPTHEYRRKWGASRLSIFKSGWRFLWCLRHLV